MIFETTGSEILTVGYATGCTDYAIAFATLARAKGIPTVVVDSAKMGWIRDGCNLGGVAGHFFVEVLIEDTWYLIDSTAGYLYENYDRNNWYLPSEYVAFTKALSVIDTGATEGTHNLLQRVAFLGKMVEWRNPWYRAVNLRDQALQQSLKTSYDSLNLAADPSRLSLQTGGQVFTIEATLSTINFADITQPADTDQISESGEGSTDTGSCDGQHPEGEAAKGEGDTSCAALEEEVERLRAELEQERQRVAELEQLLDTKEIITLELPVGKEYALRNGTRVELDTPALIINGLTMVPVRFVSEGLGASVEWNQERFTVIITFIPE